MFNDQFAKHSPPEILNTALEGVVLVMKAMGIEKVATLYFCASQPYTTDLPI